MRNEPLITHNAIHLLVEDAIAYVFSIHKINGYDPATSILDFKTSNPQQAYFHRYIGLAINHQCAIDDSIQFAKEEGFDPDLWPQQSSLDAREQAGFCLEIVRKKTKPVNLTIIHMLAFAAFLCRLAMQSGRTDLVSIMIWRVVHNFSIRFPLQWIYFDARHWAMAYSIRHFEIHKEFTEKAQYQDSSQEY